MQLDPTKEHSRKKNSGIERSVAISLYRGHTSTECCQMFVF